MKCHIVDDETMQLIRRALQSGSRHNIRVCKTALLKINGTPLLAQVVNRINDLCTTDAQQYRNQKELNALQFLRSAMEHGVACAEDFTLHRDHVTPGSYTARMLDEVKELLRKGYTDFKLPLGEHDLENPQSLAHDLANSPYYGLEKKQ